MNGYCFTTTRLLVAIAWIATAIGSIISGIATAAEISKPTPLRVAYSAITVNQAIPWIAYDAGHFKKNGLDVELIHASSITAMQALLAGEVSVAQSVTDACVSSNLSGADTLFSRRHPRQAAVQLYREFKGQVAGGFERQTGRRHARRLDTRCARARDAENVEPGSEYRCHDRAAQ